MAGVSVEGSKGGRRSLDSEINMIPMIDLLMVTISFLLITAVWVHMSRLDANANVPGSSTTPPCEGAECPKDAKLHVDAKDPTKFTLTWKEGSTVIRTVDVPRDASGRARGAVAFPGLAAKVSEEWRSTGIHKDASDRKFDQAVVHTGNETKYAEIVAVMDAVAKAKRPYAANGKTTQASAFEITFATD
jgi:biopolymer transport protein ExbD